MSAQHPIAKPLLSSDHHRFAIRRLGDGVLLRKHMTPDRFEEVQSKYFDRTDVRVDITDTRDSAVQVWDIRLGKWFGSR